MTFWRKRQETDRSFVTQTDYPSPHALPKYQNSVNPNFNFYSITSFAFEYVDTNRKKLEKWNIDAFIKDFDQDEIVFNSFLTKINRDVVPSYEEKQSIKIYLNASIANVLFGDVGFYRIMHQEDKMLRKVLELENSTE